jgi:hypothetical protein
MINSNSALQTMYSGANGDMINLKLQILGDPEFIKQDDVFISPIAVAGIGKPYNPDDQYLPGSRSLNLDRGQVYCWVTFRTPTDFNDATGMFDLNGKQKYSVSEFSGYYQVIDVTNEFRGGKFTQTLSLVRFTNQDAINQGPASSTSVTTNGEIQRTNATKAEVKQQQQTGNPVVSGNDVSKPPASPVAPSQPEPSQVAAKGADGDAAVASTPSEQPSNGFNSPLNINKPEFAPPAALASVASNAPTKDISDAAPTTGDPVVAPPAPTTAQTNASVLAALGSSQA